MANKAGGRKVDYITGNCRVKKSDAYFCATRRAGMMHGVAVPEITRNARAISRGFTGFTRSPAGKTALSGGCAAAGPGR
ncbi:hypothetical protein KCP75_06655 [Salmonella enterica subsp. enterica]|nr:hypothetical protein KCP75_06655 [Salmonella enterica subsp. enterica]